VLPGRRLPGEQKIKILPPLPISSRAAPRPFQLFSVIIFSRGRHPNSGLGTAPFAAAEDSRPDIKKGLPCACYSPRPVPLRAIAPGPPRRPTTPQQAQHERACAATGNHGRCPTRPQPHVQPTIWVPWHEKAPRPPPPASWQRPHRPNGRGAGRPSSSMRLAAPPPGRAGLGKLQTARPVTSDRHGTCSGHGRSATWM